MSGGTTGTPKGVVGTHGAYVICRDCSCGPGTRRPMARTVEGRHVRSRCRCSTSTPMSASQSFAILNGAPVALVPNPRDLADLLATIRRVKPAFFNGVPTLYIALLNHPDVQSGKVDFKSIKVCFCGAAPLLADTKQRFEALTGARIVEGYSLTEAMMAVCVKPGDGREQSSDPSGFRCLTSACASSTTTNGTRVMPPNEVGEIALSGAAVDGRLLEPARGDGARAARPCRRPAARRGGCTPAISAISTTTATCSSSIARRT